MRATVFKIHPGDNVLVALKDLARGESVHHAGHVYRLADDIPARHQFSGTNLQPGDEVIMYGVVVGRVQKPVMNGGLLTTENVSQATGPLSYRPFRYHWDPPDVSKFRNRTFMGYHRADGRVGTANYWLFIPTVFCENRNLDVIREALHHELGYAVAGKYRQKTQQMVELFRKGTDISTLSLDFNDPEEETQRVFKNVDGIKFLNHQGGCGGTRQDASILSKLLAAYADHPNVAGVTIMSLGCQNLQVKDFKKDLRERNPSFDKPLFIFEQQRSGSEEQLITEAIRQTFSGLIDANKLERKPATLDQLTIGVKGGVSDGFSGLWANPAVGYCSDLLVALGGKVLLAGFPDLNGAEQNLLDRTRNEAAAGKFVQLMTGYKETAGKAGPGFQARSSPGNIRDGLVTDAMKSNGAISKGGSSPVEDILDYTEPARKKGLNLVCTPGNDVEATTGQAASGANLILFATASGTPTGNPVCPVIKLSTSADLAGRMSDIVDIDCGPIIEGEKTIEQMGEEILEYCIRAAGGEVTPKTVQLSQDDFIPWKRGVSL
jgi:altronate hydrolase